MSNAYAKNVGYMYMICTKFFYDIKGKPNNMFTHLYKEINIKVLKKIKDKPIDMEMCIKSQRRDVAGFIVHRDDSKLVLLDSDANEV